MKSTPLIFSDSPQKLNFRFNNATFCWLAILAALANTIFYGYSKLWLPFFLGVVSIIILALGAFLITRKTFWAAWYGAIVFVNLQIFLASYLMSISSGCFLLLSAYVLSLLFFLRHITSVAQKLLPVVVCVVNMACILLLCSYNHGYAQPTGLQVEINLYINTIATTILIVLYLAMVLSYLQLKQQKLLRISKFRDNVYNRSLEAVIVLDRNRKAIVDFNSTAAEIFGFTILPDAPLSEQYYHNVVSQIVNSPMYGCSPEQPQWNGEHTFKTNGQTSIVTDATSLCFEMDGILYIKVSFVDITTEKSFEEESRKSKKDALVALHAKERFLSNMSHELRTPLNGIIGASEIFMQNNPEFKLDEFFKIISISSRHMYQLVNQVLDFASLENRPAPVSETQFHLHELLKEVITLFAIEARRKNLSLNLETEPGLPEYILGDQLKLKQTLINLVSNAVKFSEAGKVVLSVHCPFRNADGLKIFYSVADNGIGVSPEKKEKIFEAFVQADDETTRRFGGTGLGLAIAQQSVVKMGGIIIHGDNLSQGSIFSFSLTHRLPAKQIIDADHAPKFFDLKGVHILVVEDNAINRKIAMINCRRWGANVQGASNGTEAWEILTQHHYSVLLVDLEMPGMDGKTLCKKIRESGNDVPLIAFTAATYNELYSDLIRTGFTDVISKPFDPQNLNHAIHRVTIALTQDDATLINT